MFLRSLHWLVEFLFFIHSFVGNRRSFWKWVKEIISLIYIYIKWRVLKDDISILCHLLIKCISLFFHPPSSPTWDGKLWDRQDDELRWLRFNQINTCSQIVFSLSFPFLLILIIQLSLSWLMMVDEMRWWMRWKCQPSSSNKSVSQSTISSYLSNLRNEDQVEFEHWDFWEGSSSCFILKEEEMMRW